MILNGDTLPCEDSGKDAGTIKAAQAGIEIIHKMLYFYKIFDLFIKGFFYRRDDFNLSVIETVMTVHSMKLFIGMVMKKRLLADPVVYLNVRHDAWHFSLTQV